MPLVERVAPEMPIQLSVPFVQCFHRRLFRPHNTKVACQYIDSLPRQYAEPYGTYVSEAARRDQWLSNVDKLMGDGGQIVFNLNDRDRVR